MSGTRSAAARATNNTRTSCLSEAVRYQSAQYSSLNYQVNVKVLDNNRQAVQISRKVIASLKLEKLIKVELSSGEKFKDRQKFEVIVLAAMAGQDESEKKKIFSAIEKNSLLETHVIARSSSSNIYPKITQDAYKKFRPILTVSPFE